MKISTFVFWQFVVINSDFSFFSSISSVSTSWAKVEAKRIKLIFQEHLIFVFFFFLHLFSKFWLFIRRSCISVSLVTDRKIKRSSVAPPPILALWRERIPPKAGLHHQRREMMIFRQFMKEKKYSQEKINYQAGKAKEKAQKWLRKNHNCFNVPKNYQ